MGYRSFTPAERVEVGSRPSSRTVASTHQAAGVIFCHVADAA